MTERILLYVGTYTRPTDFLPEANADGIYIFEFDISTGKLTQVGEMQGIDNPSFLSIDHTNQYLYANSEVYEWHEGLITAFSINQATGELTYLNKQSTLGHSSAYNIVEHTNQYVLVANYGNRHGLVMLPINADGSLSPASDSHEFTETPEGTVPDRQDRSHVHCVMIDPTNTYVIVNDLGLDRISVYKLDLDAGKLILHNLSSVEVPAGAGPRHLAFHPNGRYVYASLELSSSVMAMKFDSSSGALEAIQTISSLPSDLDEYSHNSDIHVTPSGKYLYVGNRGHDSLAMYSIDENTGLLTLIGYQSTQGKTPRNFAIDPTGDYVLVANQDSDNIVVFKINHNTGQLMTTEITIACPTPVCLKFITL
jgi:6-phosphogluconolactonase